MVYNCWVFLYTFSKKNSRVLHSQDRGQTKAKLREGVPQQNISKNKVLEVDQKKEEKKNNNNKKEEVQILNSGTIFPESTSLNFLKYHFKILQLFYKVDKEKKMSVYDL